MKVSMVKANLGKNCAAVKNKNVANNSIKQVSTGKKIGILSALAILGLSAKIGMNAGNDNNQAQRNEAILNAPDNEQVNRRRLTMLPREIQASAARERRLTMIPQDFQK